MQGLLIFGLWKRIRPILVLWLVIEFLTTIIVFGGIIAGTVMIEMIAGKDGLISEKKIFFVQPSKIKRV